MMRRYPSAPHPFIIEPPLAPPPEYASGEEGEFGLVLVGRAIEYLPYFIYAFDELGRNAGLGKGRAKFLLRAVHQRAAGDDSLCIYDDASRALGSVAPPTSWAAYIGEPLPPAVRLRFLTPTRLKFEGELTTDVSLHVLVRNLLRRLSSLSYFHCGGAVEGFDYKGSIENSRQISLERHELKWHDWERWSSRQDSRMSMGGFLGEADYRGDLREALPLLWAGEVLHVGKGATFGLGQYTLEPFA